MENNIAEVLSSYFEHLCNTGYISTKETKKLLAYLFIYDLLDAKYGLDINDEDYNIIKAALICLCDNSCLLPYPHFNRTGLVRRYKGYYIRTSMNNESRLTENKDIRIANT
ncbi:MAG: hypothetical protein IJU02_07100 [Lachnospiraceae bacterium]|nr:hypothetical protein [Lachnospiraceae bacterium]